MMAIGQNISEVDQLQIIFLSFFKFMLFICLFVGRGGGGGYCYLCFAICFAIYIFFFFWGGGGPVLWCGVFFSL